MTPGQEAWHEAGHGVVAHLLGGQVRELSLESDRDDADAHAVVTWPDVEGDADDHTRRLAMVALAGPLAERLYLGDEVLHDLAALSSWRSDWALAETQLARLHGSAVERASTLRTLVGRVIELLEAPTTHEALARVADALDAHRTLDDTLFEDALAQP